MASATSMSTEAARSLVSFFLILAAALSLRIAGLHQVQPTFDELHYRQDMLNVPGLIGTGVFREHSVRHNQGNAPHGLLSQWLSHTIGLNALKVAPAPLVPQSIMSRENFYSRLSNALLSTLSVALLYFLARELFTQSAALLVMLLAALSPLLILFGRTEYLDTPQAVFALAALWALWRAVQAKSAKGLSLAALGAGLACGFAIGAKWSTLYLVPAFPALFALIRRRPREIGLFAACFAGAFVLAASCFHSLESWKWVLFADPNDGYGDPNYERGLLDMVRQNLWHFFDARNLVGFLLIWGGLALPVLFTSALRHWLAGLRSGKPLAKRELYVATVVLIGFAFNFMQGGDFVSWRSCLPAMLFILATGLAFEHLHSRKHAVAALAIVATTLPLSLHQGLRLGPAIVKYYGSQFTYFSQRVECKSDMVCTYEDVTESR